MAEVNRVMVNIRDFGKEVREVLNSPELCQQWLKNLHDCLLYGIEGVSSFGDALRCEAIAYTEKISEIKRNAVNARWHPKKSSTEPPTKEELYDFASLKNIDHAIARQFWEIAESRNWCDKNGKPIANWNGALINFEKRMMMKND